MIIEGESLYDFYKRNKICPQCGQNDAAPGKTRCLNCLSVAAERQREKISKETEEEKKERLRRNREYRKKLDAERKRNGLCIACGKPQWSKSTIYCYEHVLINRRNNEKRKQPIARNERKAYGKCYVCNEPVGKCGSMCDKCYEMVCANLPKSMNEGLYKMRKKQNKAIFNN